VQPNGTIKAGTDSLASQMAISTKEKRRRAAMKTTAKESKRILITVSLWRQLRGWLVSSSK
jgi:hypothetical protein